MSEYINIEYHWCENTSTADECDSNKNVRK